MEIENQEFRFGHVMLEISVNIHMEIFWSGALKGGLSERHKRVNHPYTYSIYTYTDSI